MWISIYAKQSDQCLKQYLDNDEQIKNFSGALVSKVK